MERATVIPRLTGEIVDRHHVRSRAGAPVPATVASAITSACQNGVIFDQRRFLSGEARLVYEVNDNREALAEASASFCKPIRFNQERMQSRHKHLRMRPVLPCLRVNVPTVSLFLVKLTVKVIVSPLIEPAYDAASSFCSSILLGPPRSFACTPFTINFPSRLGAIFSVIRPCAQS